MLTHFAWDVPTSRLWLALRVLAACSAAVPIACSPLPALLSVLGAILCAAILLQPFASIPVMFFLGMSGDLQHFSMGFSLVKVVMVLLLVGIAASVVVGRLQLRKTGLELPFVFFVLIYCGGAARGVGSLVSPYGVITMLGYPLAFIAVLNLVRTERHIRWVMAAVSGGALLASTASLLDQYAGFNLLVSLRGLSPVDAEAVATGWHRTMGLMQDPNGTAYPYLIAIPLLFAAALATRNWWLKAILLAVLAASVLGLTITFSRSAYLGVAGGLLYLAVKLRARGLVRLFVAATFLVAIIVNLIPRQALLARFASEPLEVGEGDREAQYEAAFTVVQEHPLLGAGQESFSSEMSRWTGVAYTAHSNLLNVAVNSGIIGLAALVWLVASYVGFVRRGLASMGWSPLKYYAVGSCAGLIAFSIQGFFIANMGWFLVWSLAAIPPCCILAEHAKQLRAKGRHTLPASPKR